MRISDWSSDVCSSDLADFFGDVSAAKPAIGNVGFAFPALQVIDAGQPDRATVQLGFAHGAHERGISTVTRAIDAEPIGIRVALRNRPAPRIADVVDHISEELRGGKECVRTWKSR